jgi:hypothetical protein
MPTVLARVGRSPCDANLMGGLRPSHSASSHKVKRVGNLTALVVRAVRRSSRSGSVGLQRGDLLGAHGPKGG